MPPVWHVSPVAVQSTQGTPPTPHAVAVVPLLQFKPVSQQPAHCGHGIAAPPSRELAVLDAVDELERLDDDLEVEFAIVPELVLVPLVVVARDDVLAAAADGVLAKAAPVVDATLPLDAAVEAAVPLVEPPIPFAVCEL